KVLLQATEDLFNCVKRGIYESRAHLVLAGMIRDRGEGPDSDVLIELYVDSYHARLDLKDGAPRATPFDLILKIMRATTVIERDDIERRLRSGHTSENMELLEQLAEKERAAGQAERPAPAGAPPRQP